ncbi:MAG: hypothetical protein IJQ21_08610 [Lachnospiraceae bacterium]|nr:hypothetical protein [Lachnospiraceae bacterium]
MKPRQALSALVCAILTAALFLCAQSFLADKGSYFKNAGFYEDDRDYEVLFFGSSMAVMAVAPMELWHDYGITSYNLANYGQYLPVDYHVLQNALDYGIPRLAVFDTAMLESDDLYYEMFTGQLHETFDIMPLTRKKYNAIRELMPAERQTEYLFPFSRYHTRWSVIDESFFKPKTRGTEKGAYLDGANEISYARVAPRVPPVWTTRDVPGSADTNGKIYLRKCVELCRENGVAVLLTAYPVFADEAAQADVNRIHAGAREIADAYGTGFFNMQQEEGLIDYGTDLVDDTHVNSSGMRKVTRRLGAYLKEHYDLTDYRDEPVAEQWNRDYADYTGYKIQWLRSQEAPESYLMLLAEEPYRVEIISHDDTAFQDALLQALLENLKDCHLTRAEQNAEGHRAEITVYHRETGDVIDRAYLNGEGKVTR